MTHDELEKLVGKTIPPKVIVWITPDATFRKLADGTWEPYPAYPDPPSAA